MDLAEREAGPQPRWEDFDTTKDYLVAWHTWRSIHNDCRLPTEAIDFKMELLRQVLMKRYC